MIDVKKIITFIALFALTSAAMAADVQGQINSATAKGGRNCSRNCRRCWCFGGCG